MEVRNIVINTHRSNLISEKNLLDWVVTEVVSVDDISVTEVERVIISGMATDIVSNVTKVSPTRNEQQQVRLNDASFLLL
jgi:hypothetical protein